MLIEIRVTHAVDKAKQIKLMELGLPALEIDLSNLPSDVTLELLKEKVLEDLANKKWLVYPREQEAREELARRLAAKIKKLEAAHLTKIADLSQKRAHRPYTKKTIKPDFVKKSSSLQDSLPSLASRRSVLLWKAYWPVQNGAFEPAFLEKANTLLDGHHWAPELKEILKKLTPSTHKQDVKEVISGWLKTGIPELALFHFLKESGLLLQSY